MSPSHSQPRGRAQRWRLPQKASAYRVPRPVQPSPSYRAFFVCRCLAPRSGRRKLLAYYHQKRRNQRWRRARPAGPERMYVDDDERAARASSRLTPPSAGLFIFVSPESRIDANAMARVQAGCIYPKSLTKQTVCYCYLLPNERADPWPDLCACDCATPARLVHKVKFSESSFKVC